MQTNTYQGVLVTDGTNSYSVFTYCCGIMEWSDEPTTIGFKINSHYLNNPYSGNSANTIACANQLSEWSTVLYSLSPGSMFAWMEFPSEYSEIRDSSPG